MKKIYSLLALALMSMMAMAQSFQFPGQLTVSVNSEETKMRTSVFFTINENETVDFSLPNFCLVSEEGNEIGVGNILIENIPLVPVDDDTYSFKYNNKITITEGTKPGVDMWIGPNLGEVPLEMKGSFNDATGALVVDIDINMQATLGQTIKVNFTSEAGTLAFTDQLTVSVNGQSTSQETTVYLQADDETETNNFILPNFCLNDGQNVIPVGNIVIPGIELDEVDETELFSFSFEGNINIQPGDQEGVEMWMGPMLGPVPVKLQGYYDFNTIYVYITISMMVGEEHQDIIVTFGDSKMIEGVHSATLAPASQRSYDLQGRVNMGQRGIMIQSGKKVVR